MTIKIDPQVRAVVGFMQANFEASRLLSIAKGVAALAPVIWGHHPFEEVAPPRLFEQPPTSGGDQQTQSGAIE